MDKEISKKIFLKNKILHPNILNMISIKIKILLHKLKKKLKFPVVVKPINEGSSVNVYICSKQNFFKKLKKIIKL